MAKHKPPATPALRALKEESVRFEGFPYNYEEKGGTEVAARELGIEERFVIKTLVMEDDRKAPFLVLMHGDKQVSSKALARFLGAKSITPCDPSTAEKHTGYQVGGISPFGTRKRLPVYVEYSIMELPEIYINGGKRGFLIKIATTDLDKVLRPTAVKVSRE